MSEKLIRDFMMLWATIDPIGTLSLFLAVTAAYSAQQRKRIAVRCIAYSAIILLATIIVGQLLLSAMEISLASFQIAGSVILFLFGLQMIFGSASPEERPKRTSRTTSPCSRWPSPRLPVPARSWL